MHYLLRARKPICVLLLDMLLLLTSRLIPLSQHRDHAPKMRKWMGPGLLNSAGRPAK
jgi:hypothetical protein